MTKPGVKERLIIVPVIDGAANSRLVHQPAPFVERNHPHGAGVRLDWLFARIERGQGIPPLEWPSVCGIEGYVYRDEAGGIFSTSERCSACRIAEAA